MARSMRYSVVMLAFGDAIREASMVAALNKIRVGATTPQSDYEIIIVNNGRVYGTSDPRLEAFGGQFRVKLHRCLVESQLDDR